MFLAILFCVGITAHGAVAPEKIVHASVSGYSAIDSCRTKACTMASGKSAYQGAVACPQALPLGTKIIINNTVYTCEDRTANWIQKRYGPTFDIFFGYDNAAHARALAWGRRIIDVQIVK